MKKLITIVILLASVYSFGQSTSDVNTVNALMKKEKKVLDFTYTSANVLIVCVTDDGTRRDGLAEYYCGLLKSNGVDAFKVRIIKYGSQNSPKKDTPYGIKLGNINANRINSQKNNTYISNYDVNNFNNIHFEIVGLSS